MLSQFIFLIFRDSIEWLADPGCHSLLQEKQRVCFLNSLARKSAALFAGLFSNNRLLIHVFAKRLLTLLTLLSLAPIFGLSQKWNRGESAIQFQISINLFLSSSRPRAIRDLTVPILISRTVEISS